MLQLRNISFGYRKDKNLFDKLNLQLHPGFICGLLGKNGAGKTTLLNIITGLRFANSGEVLFNGLNAKNRDYKYLSNYFLVPEEISLPAVTTTAFLKTYSPFYPKFSEEAFFDYFHKFNVPKGILLTKMSLGEKKKFFLSFGLATNTEVLLMDEPTNGLDIPSKSLFRKIMAAAITDERLFVISTHQVKDIEGILDQIIVLENGTIAFDATVDEITNHLTFKKISTLPLDEAVIYKEETLGGYNVITENRKKEYAEIDIELLFKAIISNTGINDYISTK